MNMACLAPSLVLITELFVVLATLGLILIRSRNEPGDFHLFRSIERVFSKVARRRLLSAVAVGLFVLGSERP